MTEKFETKIVGKVTRWKDGVARVTGQEMYTVDVSLPRMLFARLVSSPYDYARINHIDVRRAQEMGATVITFDDIPHIRYNERIITVPWALHKDRYVLADKVRRMGEAVAAVAAETEELAEKAPAPSRWNTKSCRSSSTQTKPCCQAPRLYTKPSSMGIKKFRLPTILPAAGISKKATSIKLFPKRT
jgi:xanthine dehydrogenase molybdopterin-binding subunit B